MRESRRGSLCALRCHPGEADLHAARDATTRKGDHPHSYAPSLSFRNSTHARTFADCASRAG